MSIHEIASDDVVRSHEEGALNERPPLLVLDPLLAFLDAVGLGDGEPEVQPVGDGHSNVTYLVTRGDAEFVVRRPPRGPLPPSAHDVLREARVLRGLEGRARVPKVLAVCDDEAVIGAPFYVMEKVEGLVVTTEVPDALDTDGGPHADGRGARRCARRGARRGLARRPGSRASASRPATSSASCGASSASGRSTARATSRPSRRSAAGSPTRCPSRARRRSSTATTGSATRCSRRRRPARLVAIFDWEMSTIGDPKADLGYLCTLWTDRDDPPAGMFELTGVTREPGFLSRDDLVARYEERSGRAMTDIRWYQTLALWKSIVFMEGNYKRAIGRSDGRPVPQARSATASSSWPPRAEELTRGALSSTSTPRSRAGCSSTGAAC